ncbi:Bleomycin resistance protein [Edwardsiella anguillarum]|uniref:glyoxalase/bleomycin resistance/dioxygenase family protein n=1 Tax=Edwardsiella TaxID=635 RepID=UPI00045CB17D|nr:glyoxalase/bleomycin resistance/dioxygenase family protein [Edwardsiella anguillarum]AKM47890.1 glyoxalase [Edwardsiella sp. EA181011]GAJ68854.1 bleomycin resistance protein [Edwardsiella piscicida]RFT05452.1 glyoxalase/bleomycin resistance/dioxygenase family protein [Edwardsiella anguillarum]BET80905.1 Bleomycin resistance protein [Edwardsiella anguillarum]BET84194.1 Bleomycin resistance protein [Edwardsiella anguillarum]
MAQNLPEIDVLFVAGFGPIAQDTESSTAFYVRTLGLPLNPMEGNCDYLLSEEGLLKGVKHFAVWPLSQAATSCFGVGLWPTEHPIPQGWIEYEVQDLDSATRILVEKGYSLFVANRIEPWGQTVTRLLSPEGLLTGLTMTPWLRG